MKPKILIITGQQQAMKVLVLGASGGVGKHLVRLACEQGHIVTALARVTAAHSTGEVRGELPDDRRDFTRGCRLVDTGARSPADSRTHADDLRRVTVLLT